MTLKISSFSSGQVNTLPSIFHPLIGASLMLIYPSALRNQYINSFLRDDTELAI